MISRGPYLDSRTRPFFEQVGQNDEWAVVLPHQCDNWHVGTPEDIDALIADLTTIRDMRPPASARYEWSPLDD